MYYNVFRLGYWNLVNLDKIHQKTKEIQMKNLLLKVLLILGALGFSFASASGLDVKVGDDFIYSISGDKFIVEVIDVKAGGALFTAQAEIKNVNYMFIFEKMPDDIYNVVMLRDKKYSTSDYFKKDGEFFRSYLLKTKVFLDDEGENRNYFTKI